MVQSSQKPAHLGFIGIGRMGLPMTARLIAAGHNVTVSPPKKQERLLQHMRLRSPIEPRLSFYASPTERLSKK
jgi:pyrroline-5-carboxylate reductase